MSSPFTVPERRIGRCAGPSGVVGPGRSCRKVPVVTNLSSRSVSIAPGTVARPQSNSISVDAAAMVIEMCCPPH
ncbi:MAG: hypothetical protein DMG03_13995 [Acidobacteria bacterium]|nr:MAG: hypothetical protein DMG03_13995 [Acidobacteriota bacterium]